MFLFFRFGFDIKTPPNYEITVLFFITFACTACYLQHCFVSLLMISISYFVVGAVKDFNMTLREVDDIKIPINGFDLDSLRLNKLITSVHDHRELMTYISQ